MSFMTWSQTVKFDFPTWVHEALMMQDDVTKTHLLSTVSQYDFMSTPFGLIVKGSLKRKQSRNKRQRCIMSFLGLDQMNQTKDVRAL